MIATTAPALRMLESLTFRIGRLLAHYAVPKDRLTSRSPTTSHQRSVRHLTALAAELEALGVDLVVLDQAIDTGTPAGRLLFHVLGSMAEFERDLIAEPAKGQAGYHEASWRSEWFCGSTFAGRLGPQGKGCLRNCRISPASSSGASNCGKWPTPSKSRNS